MGDCTYRLTRYFKEKYDGRKVVSGIFSVIGTVVVVIGDGVDYLDPQLIREDGSSRIIKIVDQNILDKYETGNLTKYGVEYSRAEIDNAIREFRVGRNPYNIVPQYAESDFTTDMCKVIGGNATGVLIENEFITIKLKRNGDGCYCEKNIIEALDYIYEEAGKLKAPMAVYLPVETESRLSEGGLEELERTIRKLSEIKGVIIVTTTGSMNGDGVGFSASGLAELLEVVTSAPYSEVFKGLGCSTGKINYKDYKTLAPILFNDEGYPIVYENTLYLVRGVAVSGALGTAAVAAILEWAIIKGNKNNLYPEDVRIKLIEAADNGYVEDAGYGPVDIKKLNLLLM